MSEREEVTSHQLRAAHWNTLMSKGRGMKQYYACGKSGTKANYDEALKPRDHVVKQ